MKLVSQNSRLGYKHKILYFNVSVKIPLTSPIWMVIPLFSRSSSNKVYGITNTWLYNCIFE